MISSVKIQYTPHIQWAGTSSQLVVLVEYRTQWGRVRYGRRSKIDADNRTRRPPRDTDKYNRNLTFRRAHTMTMTKFRVGPDVRGLELARLDLI